MMDWAAEDLGGRLPLAITVFGATARGADRFVRGGRRARRRLGHSPTPANRERRSPRSSWSTSSAAVADASPVPVAIQNAPQYIGVGLSVRRARPAEPAASERAPAQGRGLGGRDPGADRADRGPDGRVPGPGRHGVHRRDARGLHRHDPLGRILPSPGADLRADADRRAPRTRRRPSAFTPGSRP